MTSNISALKYFEYLRLNALEALKHNILDLFILNIYNLDELKEFKYYLHSNNRKENEPIIKSIESFEKKLNETTEYKYCLDMVGVKGTIQTI